LLYKFTVCKYGYDWHRTVTYIAVGAGGVSLVRAERADIVKNMSADVELSCEVQYTIVCRYLCNTGIGVWPIL